MRVVKQGFRWDKTYCLKYLTPHYESIYFFGDKTAPVWATVVL